MNITHNRYLLTIALAAIIWLPLTAHSDADKSSLTALLDNISAAIASINALAATTTARYRFGYEAAFPCSVTVTESSYLNDAEWIRRYRFELSDISAGTLFSSRDGRRAISYYGKKITVDGTTEEYPPKKISAFRLTAGSQPVDSIELRRNLDKAITRCSKRNEF